MLFGAIHDGGTDDSDCNRNDKNVINASKLCHTLNIWIIRSGFLSNLYLYKKKWYHSLQLACTTILVLKNKLKNDTLTRELSGVTLLTL